MRVPVFLVSEWGVVDVQRLTRSMFGVKRERARARERNPLVRVADDKK